MQVEFVTPEEHHMVVRDVQELRTLFIELIESLDEEVDTKRALKITGIRSATTLIAERQRPDTLIRFSKHGRSTSYSLASCLAYKRAHRLGS